MKSFILAVIFIAFSVSAEKTQSEQLGTQIQCYLRKLKALIPADAVPQDDALIRDVRLVQKNLNAFSENGVEHCLKDASAQLAKAIPKLKDPKLRALATQMMAKIKAVEVKFKSGNGDFNDIFNLNTIIKNSLKENLGGGCDKSTLPDGVTTSNVVTTQIKKYLSKLKASAPQNAKPIYDKLTKNMDDVMAESIELDRNGVINSLKKAANNVKNLTATLSDSQARRQQQNILEKLNALIKKLKSGNGTYKNVYKFMQFVEKTLAQDE